MPSSDSRRRRNLSIRHAIGTSMLSKLSTLALQFVSLPVAARVLGREEFGIYATISLAVFSVAMLQLGVGPALARRLSEASTQSDHREEGRIFLSGAILVVGLALLGFLVVAILITALPISTLFGAEYAAFEEVMRPALWTGAILMTAQVIVALTDRVREGYMEAAIVNSWSAAGNLLGAIVVFLGIRYQPSISFLLVAVFGPNILVRIVSTILLLKKRPWLVARSSRPSIAAMVELARDGISFSATNLGVYLTEFVACALIVGRIRGPADVAIFQVLMSIATAFSGLLSMVGTPLWAAIVDAKTKGDHRWMVTATFRYYAYLSVLTIAAGIALIGFGPWFVPLVYGSEFSVDRLLFVGHAIFLFAMGWRYVNRFLAIGLGLLPRTVVPILTGLALGLALGIPGLKTHGLWMLYTGLAVGNLLIAGWILPRLVLGNLRIASESDRIPLLPSLIPSRGLFQR